MSDIIMAIGAKGAEGLSHDASTNGLIRHYRAWLSAST